MQSNCSKAKQGDTSGALITSSWPDHQSEQMHLASVLGHHAGRLAASMLMHVVMTMAAAWSTGVSLTPPACQRGEAMAGSKRCQALGGHRHDDPLGGILKSFQQLRSTVLLQQHCLR